MKKLIALASTALLFSSPVFASKARLQALGEDKDGSFYLPDYRNIFINPAQVNNYGNNVYLEYGDSGQNFSAAGLGTKGTVDADSKTKAEGGFFKKGESLTYGAFLGDESDTSALLRLLSSNGASRFTQTPDNMLDIFVAGGSDYKWGANLLGFQHNDEGATGHTSESYASRWGIMKDNWQVSALVALGSRVVDPTAGVRFKGKTGYRLTGGYDYNGYNAYASYEGLGWDQTLNATKTESSFNKGHVGVGRVFEVATGSRFMARTSYDFISIEMKYTTKAKIDRYAVPLVVGFEHDATDWLTFRGSVTQNLFGQVKTSGFGENFGTGVSGGSLLTTGYWLRSLANARYGTPVNGGNGKKTLDGTDVQAGATLKFGQISVDGVVGMTKFSRASTTSGEEGVLSKDNLATRVSMNYNF